MQTDPNSGSLLTFLTEAQRLDEIDVLAALRGRFYLPRNTIYLDGNSLGPLSRDAEVALSNAIEAWKALLIEGWTAGDSPWFTLAERLGKRTGALLGAEAGSVVVTGSTTVNLHQLVATLLPTAILERSVVMDETAFPSDVYAMRSALAGRGLNVDKVLHLVPTDASGLLQEKALIKAMEGAKFVVLPAVVYTTGQLLDMQRLTAAAHDAGSLIGFDCAHSVGSVQHKLDEWGVDFAFWCSYKYLNAGPGASGGLYLNRRHWNSIPGLAGWFGTNKAKQLQMLPTMEPAPGVGRLQIGTPNILSMAPLEGSLKVIEDAGLTNMRTKSISQTSFMMSMLTDEINSGLITVVTPEDASKRGGHISLKHPGAAGLSQALRARGVIPDFRPPDILRLAPAPLYITFQDCYHAIRQIKELLNSPGDWQHITPGIVP
jgi:kynureninase